MRKQVQQELNVNKAANFAITINALQIVIVVCAAAYVCFSDTLHLDMNLVRFANHCVVLTATRRWPGSPG